jgi:hypothetical protein
MFRHLTIPAFLSAEETCTIWSSRLLFPESVVGEVLLVDAASVVGEDRVALDYFH